MTNASDVVGAPSSLEAILIPFSVEEVKWNGLTPAAAAAVAIVRGCEAARTHWVVARERFWPSITADACGGVVVGGLVEVGRRAGGAGECVRSGY